MAGHENERGPLLDEIRLQYLNDDQERYKLYLSEFKQTTLSKKHADEIRAIMRNPALADDQAKIEAIRQVLDPRRNGIVQTYSGRQTPPKH